MSEAAVPLPLPREAPPPAPRWRADLALVVAAFFFGTTFLIGGAVLGLLGRRRPASPGELRDGVAGGAALLAGYVLQTVGLQYTTPSTSAFITYLLVVFVPLIGFVALGRRPHPLTLVGLVMAVVGLVLLTGGADASFGKGEVLTMGCAVAFAAHIVIVGETAGRHDAIRFTCVQVTTVGLACLGLSVFTGGLAMPGSAVAAAAFTGVFATALAFWAMVWAQRVVSPSRAALILLLEPVFAALLSALAGDPLTAGALAGGALILAAVVVAEVMPAYLGGREAVSH